MWVRRITILKRAVTDGLMEGNFGSRPEGGEGAGEGVLDTGTRHKVAYILPYRNYTGTQL